MDRLRDTLHWNNYPKRITSALRNLDHKTEDKTQKLTTVCLHYFKGLAKKTFFKYVVHMSSGPHLGVAQLFVNIRVKPLTELCIIPSHAAVAKYTKTRYESKTTGTWWDIEKSGIADYIYIERKWKPSTLVG